MSSSITQLSRSVAITGAGAGLVAAQFGHVAVYLLGAASALLGAALIGARRSTAA
jgi:hypothetical protein